MPYEAAVLVHRRALWPAVADPRRLFGALPGAVVEAADAHGAAGRLRLRVGQQTVTFRGIARIVEVDEEAWLAAVELEAAFGRNGGGVEGRLEIRLQEDGAGTLAVVDGTVEFEGTAAAPAAQSLEAAGHRLFKKWFAALAESIEAESIEAEAGPETAPEPGPESESEPEAETAAAPETAAEPEAPVAEAVPAQPEAAESEPTESDPAESEPAPAEPTASEATASEPAEPVGSAQPEPAEPAAEPSPTEPSSAEPEEPVRPAAHGSRPPLAVVPDLDSGDGETAGPTADGPPLPQRRAQPKSSAPAAKSRAAESVSGGAPGRPRAADFEAGAAAVDRDAPARLHLVQPTGGEPDGEDDAADDEPDIWSRRKPFLPRWLPYLAGATFVGALAFLIAVLGYLRRLRRARQD